MTKETKKKPAARYKRMMKSKNKDQLTFKKVCEVIDETFRAKVEARRKQTRPKRDSDFENLKKDRHAQWGSENQGQPRGWNSWRPSTFLEVCQAKIDRAIQCLELIQFRQKQLESVELLDERQYHREKKEDMIYDLWDSLRDNMNYAAEFIKKMESDPNFIANNGMR